MYNVGHGCTRHCNIRVLYVYICRRIELFRFHRSICSHSLHASVRVCPCNVTLNPKYALSYVGYFVHDKTNLQRHTTHTTTLRITSLTPQDSFVYIWRRIGKGRSFITFHISIYAAGSFTLRYMPPVIHREIFQLDFGVGSSLNDHRADLRK